MQPRVGQPWWMAREARQVKRQAKCANAVGGWWSSLGGWRGVMPKFVGTGAKLQAARACR